MPKVYRTLFLGTDNFALTCLKALLERSNQPGARISSIEVVALPAKKRATRSPVAKYAAESKLPLHTWPPLASHIVDRFDTAAVVSFGALLPDCFLDLLPLPCVNVHPSLLPRWRGAAPLAHTIMAGDKMTGVSLLQVSKKKFDVGPILMQRQCPVPEDCDVVELSAMLAPIGSEMLVECLEDYEGYLNKSQPQPKGGTWANKIISDMAKVQWEMVTANDVIWRQRALCDRYVLMAGFDSVPLQLHGIGNLLEVVPDEADFIPAIVSRTPGTVFHRSDSNFLCVRCKEGWVTVEELFLVGNNCRKSAEDFAIDHLDDLDEDSDSASSSSSSSSSAASQAGGSSPPNQRAKQDDHPDVFRYVGTFHGCALRGGR